MNGSPNGAVPALRVRDLVKRYGDFVAVDGVSLEVSAGDFFAFLGPNGAGKTTTINAIVGLASLTSGSIEIFGHDNQVEWRAARRLVGLAPQEYNFDRYLSIRDILIYQAGYYGLRRRDVRARADALLERFGLGEKADQTYLKLSGGMKRRLSLARALVHDPSLLILDEPTAGVDVELRLELWDLLRELNAAGTTIVLTTHYLEEAQLLCKNVAIIEGGKIAALEPTDKLLERRGTTSLALRLDRSPEPLAPALTARGATYDAATRTLCYPTIESGAIATVLAEVSSLGFVAEDVDVRRSNLQDVFLELVGK